MVNHSSIAQGQSDVLRYNAAQFSGNYFCQGSNQGQGHNSRVSHTQGHLNSQVQSNKDINGFGQSLGYRNLVAQGQIAVQSHGQAKTGPKKVNKPDHNTNVIPTLTAKRGKHSVRSDRSQNLLCNDANVHYEDQNQSYSSVVKTVNHISDQNQNF